ncbi:MAG: hypothetical protein ABIK28_25305 [Planctomycetota bacterium]
MNRSKPVFLIAFMIPLCFALSPASPARVWTVGPGGDFAQIQEAVDAAAHGDEILVASGSYSHVVIDDKSLGITADTGVSITLLSGMVVKNLASNHTVILAGLDGGTVLYKEGLLLDKCLGSIRVEDCTFKGAAGVNDITSPHYQPQGWEGVRVIQCADTAFTRCGMTGDNGAEIEDDTWQYPCGQGGAGLFTRDSVVVVYDCDLRGGRGGNNMDVSAYDGGNGGNGFETPDASLFASGSSFQGGDGGYGGDAFLPIFPLPQRLRICYASGGYRILQFRNHPFRSSSCIPYCSFSCLWARCNTTRTGLL